MGETIFQRLRSKKLPQMVDWYDPGLLARIGMREVISGTLGQYADQRLMQATSDRVPGDNQTQQEVNLVRRYDYSGDVPPGEDKPTATVAVDAGGGVWVDYAADLGDGFEATYAVAHLLAGERLLVQDNADPKRAFDLPAGDILVLGGDQAYPQATRLEYEHRFVAPYDAAFALKDGEEPARKMFALPGNHDWYDGLNAFDSLFCSARDRISDGKGRTIGGWRCYQHRSYWAIRLPHNWWIWGADIQLDGYLDDSQRDYFDLISEKCMGPEDKVIICLAEPSWLHKEYDNLHEINILASQTGAKVCAVLAGDWHHYSRYHNDQELGVHFITCGGGGAFAHATHSLKKSINLKWARLTSGQRPTAEPEDDPEFSKLEKRVLGEGATADFTEQRLEVSAEDAPARSVGDHVKRMTDVAEQGFLCHAPAIYPSRLTSRLLSLRNVLFPIHHFKFSMALGMLYFLFSWIAYGIYENKKELFDSQVLRIPTATEISSGITGAIENWQRTYKSWTGAERQFLPQLPPAGQPAAPAKTAPPADPPLTTAALQDGAGRDAVEESAGSETGAKPKAPPVPDEDKGGLVKQTFNFVFLGLVVSPLFFVMIAALWLGLISYVETSEYKNKVLAGLLKIGFGTAHFATHILAISALTLIINILIGAMAAGHLAFVNGTSLEQGFAPREWDLLFQKYRLVGPLLMIPIGGVIAGLIWGLYWVITCSMFSMHTGDAFGALAIRDYKHFLRMRFEPDKVTIYPIAVDRVPGPYGWRETTDKEKAEGQRSQLLPLKNLKPRLIEAPISVRADAIKVWSAQRAKAASARRWIK